MRDSQHPALTPAERIMQDSAFYSALSIQRFPFSAFHSALFIQCCDDGQNDREAASYMCQVMNESMNRYIDAFFLAGGNMEFIYLRPVYSRTASVSRVVPY